MSQDASLIDADILLTATFGKLETKTALANARLADDTHNATISLDRIFEFKRKSGELVGSASERTQPPSASKHAARGSVLKSSEFEYLDGYRDPANGFWPQMFNFNELLGGDVRLLRNEDGPSVRHLLEAIGKMHIRSSGIISLIYSVLYCLNDNFPRMNAHADMQIGIVQASYPVLHRKSGQAAAHGMIFMWLRSAKDCHHPVAL
jgi:hypothetical protein